MTQKEYKEKIIFGLNLRQLISVFVGGIICLSTYFFIKPIDKRLFWCYNMSTLHSVPCKSLIRR